LQARNEINEDRRRVGWKDAIQNLRKRWPSAAGWISRKTVHGCSRGVAQQLAEIDPWSPAVIACGYLPRFEIRSDVGIQVDPFVLAQPHHCQRKDGLTDRTRLEWCIGLNRHAFSHPPDSEPSGPGDLEVLDDGNANTWRTEFAHPIVEGAYSTQWRTAGTVRSQIGNSAIDSRTIFRRH
jgi:hypothetical protein